MSYVTLQLGENGFYTYKGADKADISILGCFLSSDVESFGTSSFRAWALADKTQQDTGWTWTFGGNITNLEEDEGFVLLTLDLPLEEDEEEVVLKMTKKQFVKLLDDWDERVYKIRPQEVIITEVNGEFIFETK